MTEKEATQEKQGVSEEEKLEAEAQKEKDLQPPGPEDDPRQQEIERIAEKHEEQEFGPAEEEEEKKLEEKEPEPKIEAEPEPKKKSEEELFTVKMDGVEKQVTHDELIASYQKAGTGDKRLEEATRLLKEAKEPQLPEKDVEEKEPEPAEDPGFTNEQLDGLGHTLQFGDEEELREALKTILATKETPPAATPAMTKEELRAEIKQELIVQDFETKFKAPVEQGGFADIFGNKDLAQLTHTRVNEAIKEGADVNDFATYSKAATEVRNLYGTKLTVSEEFKEKKEKKKEQENLGGIHKKATVEVELEVKAPKTEDEENREAIAAMDKERQAQRR